MSLPDQLRLGPVHLTVRDLERSVPFYRDVLGLRVHGQEAGRARLGTGGEDLAILHEDPEAQRAGRHSGLYHVAFLFPDRQELARAVLRLAATQPRIDGASDHGVSEAIYLADPDGNGIELYADRPRDQWPAAQPGERVGMFTAPLDLEDLLSTVSGEEPRRDAGEGLRMGHVHLHVGDLDRALAFYRDVLGFDVMATFPGAAFVSAGGYHHHLGLNTWRGEGAPAAPPHAVGLRRWTVVLGDPGQVAGVRERAEGAGFETSTEDGSVVVQDPWGIALAVVPA